MANLAATPSEKRPALTFPDLPLVVWMVLLSLGLGLAGGYDAQALVSAYNSGFAWALGEFALILLPSFTLAAALSRRNVVSAGAGRAASLVSPVAGAGMICPDTAYAALSPAAGPHKLDLAFGAYSGFKLLYPAGPLIVAAGLGVTGPAGVEPVVLLLCGVLLCLPVWCAGVLWGRAAMPPETSNQQDGEIMQRQVLVTFAPFLVMAGVLILGGGIGQTGIGAVDFLFLPKGALLLAASIALFQTAPSDRRPCLDSAVRRTGSLLLVIGAASAFGTILTNLLPMEKLAPQGSGFVTLIALFILTVVFKLAQGSSMATFAAVAPVAAPIVLSSGADPIAAVFAICLGSFVAILPNDSYYWLVRRDALDQVQSEMKVIRILAGGAIFQAVVGLIVLLAAVLVLT